MKPKKINYKIVEPCHADWDQMKPEAKGRFCSSCSKTVVDFSKMSDFSIVTYLEAKKNESICGRFEEKQLDKTYLWTKSYHQTFSFDLKAVALGLALSTFSALPYQAQNNQAIEQRDATINEPIALLQGEVITSYNHGEESHASGRIKLNDKDYESVTISLMDGNSVELISIKPNRNGIFNIPLDWKKNPTSIRVTAPGYSSHTIYFDNHKSLNNLSVQLVERRMIKGKVSR
ncbi:hypothetical protein [Fluviicola taffensis]|uniref:Uncharacterized protein n=1 Tax=Fluviicola taffensis (strain DSM 16823 / NCIMB 13979 / RW262) TaxID=755732 RepID=F2IJK9_FLUTR|nr:hypothetical protein [Fluviicola taffensis]AEA42897.1 hypothetical protein Fluta_0896 [Fluviicola taffensis DSM 16823]